MLELGPDQGFEFRDKEGVAAVVKRDGQVFYVRKGADVYTAAQTFNVEPGSHKLEYLLLNKMGFPFAVASTDIEFKTGDSKGFWFNMPADYVGQTVPQAVAPFVNMPGGDWQQEFSQRQATVKRKIQGFADDPVAQALNQAILSARLTPPDRPAVCVNLPAENGGKRELDSRLVGRWCGTLRTSTASTRAAPLRHPTAVRPTTRTRWPNSCRWSAPTTSGSNRWKKIAGRDSGRLR